MDMEAVFRKPRLLRALTGLDASEPAELLAAFEQEAQARRGQVNRFGQPRQRAPGATGNAGMLPAVKARLFFSAVLLQVLSPTGGHGRALLVSACRRCAYGSDA